jgi:hypothetical protein
MLMPSLQQFFHRQVQQGFGRHGLAQPATVDYVSDVLTRFAHTRALYPIHGRDNRPIEHIVGLLIEWRGAQEGLDMPANRGREALVVRHIGEYALFMSGLFRARLSARGQLGYYLAHGRGAYGQCATRESNPRQARVFEGLHRDFERIAQALDDMRAAQWPLHTIAPVSPLQALWRC